MKKLMFLLFMGGAYLIALSVGLFDKYASCPDLGGAGKVFSEFRNGPHYFESVNHVCRPSLPEKPVSDGRTPENSDQSIYAAWFNASGRVVKLQMYHKRGQADWLEESEYDEENFLKSVKRSSPDAHTIHEIYSKGILLGAK